MSVASAAAKRRPYRWFQFDLRSLLVIMLVVAVVLGWYQYKKEAALRERRARQAVYEIDRHGHIKYAVVDGDLRWDCFLLLQLPPTTPADLVEQLRYVAQCHRAILRGISLGDGGFDCLAEVEGLRSLDLTATDVTDRHLQSLARLADLEELILDHTAVTDQAIPTLAGMPALRRLHVSGSHVTETGVRRLKKLRDNIEISWATAPSVSHRQTARVLERDANLVAAWRSSTGATRYSVSLGFYDLVGRTGPGNALLSGLRSTDDLGASNLTLYYNLGRPENDLLRRCATIETLNLRSVSQISLAGLSQLKALGLLGCRMGNQRLAELSQLPGLRELVIDAPFGYVGAGGLQFHCVNDRGIRHLARLVQLRRLALRRMGAAEWELSAGLRHGLKADDVQMTDAGLGELVTLGRLESLDLTASPVTADGILQLRRLQNLRELILLEIPLTEGERQDLQEAFPRARLVFDPADQDGQEPAAG